MDKEELTKGIDTHHDEEDMFPDVPFLDVGTNPEIWQENKNLTGRTSLWHPNADRSIPMRVRGLIPTAIPLAL